MIQNHSYQIYPIGDQGITLDFGGEMSESVNQQVFHLYRLLENWRMDGIKDLIPAYHSISIIYDLTAIKKIAGNLSAYQFLENQLVDFASQLTHPIASQGGREIEIPVCYDPSLGPDLAELAAMHQLSIPELIQLHSSKTYRIYLIGFLPGFAYMGTIDERIKSPRKANPRTKVPAGSVGIAGLQTGIYPFESPGGWQLIGQTPMQVFDVAKKNPSLLQPGDTIRFKAIDLEEFIQLKNKAS